MVMTVSMLPYLYKLVKERGRKQVANGNETGKTKRP